MKSMLDIFYENCNNLSNNIDYPEQVVEEKLIKHWAAEIGSTVDGFFELNIYRQIDQLTIPIATYLRSHIYEKI